MLPDCIWALVPVKPLHQAKTRLSLVLTPVQRVDLMRAMLRQTLDVLLACDGLAGVLVISADAEVGALAQSLGASFVAEAPPCDLNISLTQARESAQQHGADAILIVPADLPCISTESIEQVLASAFTSTMVIVPDRGKLGTNCLFLAPPDSMAFLFGEGSFSAHTRAAQESGLCVHILRDSVLSLDVDFPADLDAARDCLRL